MSELPEWLEEAKRRNPELARAALRQYRRDDCRGYVAVLPLAEAIKIQNILASLAMLEMEDRLDEVKWGLVTGAANRLAMMCEEPFRLRVPYERFELALEEALRRLESLLD